MSGMGCNPFGRMMSMAFGRNNGVEERRRRRRWRRSCEYYDENDDDDMQIEHCTTRAVYHGPQQPMERSVVYRNTTPTVVTQKPPVVVTPSNLTVEGGGPRVRFALPEEVKEGGKKSVVKDVVQRQHSPHSPQAQERVVGAPAAVGGGLGYSYGYGRGCRYVSSPLASSSSNYYPTPVREGGIYRLGGDANRLTSLFSDENPNACTIV